MKIALVFFECVRDEGATDQFVVSDKVARITNSISPDNLLVQVEEIVRSGVGYILVAFLDAKLMASNICRLT